jgi:ABC-type transport system involved in multi-copper enzyme maturation permease subunit
MVLLAVDSFGREFSLGTFSSLMVQPLERRQIWRTKLTVLLTAAALIFAAYFISCELRLHLAFMNGHSIWAANPIITNHELAMAMLASGVVLFVALTGGLWTALLLRQIAAAFWIALLAPIGLLTLIVFFPTPVNQEPDGLGVRLVLFSAAALYVYFAFWLAHRLFFRVEDAVWTGGIVSFSKWRYFERKGQRALSLRRHRPLAVLLKKEFQLHSISLFFAVALLGLHGVVLFLRVFWSNSHPNTLAAITTDYFWCLWLILPLMIGCMAVAEERKLGVAENQLCLSVSRRRQFFLKLMCTLFLGVLLGGVLPVALETAALLSGAPSGFFKSSIPGPELNHGLVGSLIAIVALAAGLAGVSFFASTLARNFLQALSLAIVISVGCGFFVAFIGFLGDQKATFFGLMPMPWLLLFLIGMPVLLVLFLWLGYRNFCDYQESGRLWRRNLLGLLGALLFVCASSALIYNRPWEIFQPGELPHGTPVFSLANRPAFQNPYISNDLRVRLPDGRVWCDSLEEFFWKNKSNRWKQLWQALVDPVPVSGGPRAFIAGSNWVSTTTERVHFWDPNPAPLDHATEVVGHADTVGIRSDGTLWLASETKPFVWTGANMSQWGTETNWRQVIRYGNQLVLLKMDGTLWQWGTNQLAYGREWRTNWPSVRNFQPHQIGTNADWQEIFWIYARKKDGSVWQLDVDWKNGNFKLNRQTELDPVVSQTFSYPSYVGRDGTLWVINLALFNRTEHLSEEAKRFLRVGRETNWLAAAVFSYRLVALKTDGTLWQWNLSSAKTSDEFAQNPPSRLGIHHDWMALAAVPDGVVSLAADGSLWLWPDPATGQPTLLKLPEQPEFLGNVLAANRDE